MNRQGRITRSSTNRVIAGVCGGIAQQFNIDPTLVRAGFVLLTLFAGVSPWIYLILWVAIPSDTSTATSFGQQVQQNLGEIQQKATSAVEQLSDKVQHFTGGNAGQGSQTPPASQTPPQIHDQHGNDQGASGHGPTTGPTTRL